MDQLQQEFKPAFHFGLSLYNNFDYAYQEFWKFLNDEFSSTKEYTVVLVSGPNDKKLYISPSYIKTANLIASFEQTNYSVDVYIVCGFTSASIKRKDASDDLFYTVSYATSSSYDLKAFVHEMWNNCVEVLIPEKKQTKPKKESQKR